jgi:NADPH-dependent 2,4-dienoyl-CoA reductase/sulfur reductase-like enzyme/rhodanese-related sulfurtransferase
MNIVVVGGSAAGLKAACRARRLMPDANIIVVEAGEYISYAACGMPYFLAGDIEHFDTLRTSSYGILKDPEYFRTVKGIDVRLHTRAETIDRDAHVLHCQVTGDETPVAFPWDALVLAVGAEPIIPDIPGADLPGVCTFTQPADAQKLKRDCSTGTVKSVALIGAGFIGLELCEAFSALWGADVTLFESADHVLPAQLDAEVSAHVEAALTGEGIRLELNATCREIKEDDGQLRITTDAGVHPVTFDRVVMAVGLRPQLQVVKDAGIAVGATGGIVVDAAMHTSDESIYAAGDCVELRHRISGKPVRLPLGSLANRMGRVVGENITGGNATFSPVLGTSVLKAFDMTIASTGLNRSQAEEAGYSVGEMWGVFDDKPGYYPDGEAVFVKLLYEQDSKRVMGVQAVGAQAAVRRIDSAAALLLHGVTLGELLDYEPAYAPPYAEPIDPLHYLAFAADAVLRDRAPAVSPAMLCEDTWDVVLDVRNTVERKLMPLPESIDQDIHIPIDELRARIDEVPKEQSILVVCQRGTRSYEGVMMLRAAGYQDVTYLAGGAIFAIPMKSS